MNTILCFFVAFQTLCLSGLWAETAAEAPAPTAPRDQGLEQTIIMIGIALVFFYLILWRPEQKRRKAMELQRSSLKKGDKVIAMGLVGTVVKIQENTLILRMVDGSKVEVLKAAINEVMPGTEEDAKKEEKEDKCCLTHNKTEE